MKESNKELDFINDSHNIKNVVLTSNKVSKKSVDKLIKYQFYYSIAGFLIGFVCILLGIFLIFKENSSTFNFSLDFLKSKTVVKDMASGALLFLCGVFIIWLTKFKVYIKSP